MKKCFLYILIGLVLSGFPGNVWGDPINPTPLDPQPSVQAKSAILMEAPSGRVLFAKEEDRRRPIASVTKIMTAIVAIEQGKLNDLVKIGPNAVGVEGSSIYLKLGEQVPLETLLYGLMLRSGNDAAVAIAEHVGGSVEGFVHLMNEKVEQLGLQNTNFVNPHGLDNNEHYSSARDLALITAYAYKNPKFNEIVKTKVKDFSWPGEEWKRTFHNKNRMLEYYPWADGVKTGYTTNARRTLVSSATKNGIHLIAVTLDDQNDWKDSVAMFEYGFKHYDKVSLLEKGQMLFQKEIHDPKPKYVNVVADASFVYPMAKGEKRTITLEPQITKVKGDFPHPIGTARIYLQDRLIGTIPIKAEPAGIYGVFSRFKEVLTSILGWGDDLND